MFEFHVVVAARTKKTQPTFTVNRTGGAAAAGSTVNETKNAFAKFYFISLISSAVLCVLWCCAACFCEFNFVSLSFSLALL